MEQKIIAVVGLGYVGLPLVANFGKNQRCIGFDIDKSKVDSCIAGHDPSRELSDDQMAAATFAEYTNDPEMLAAADIIIIAVPTPVDSAHKPDFTPLINASRLVGENMGGEQFCPGTIVIYESTVYPGATEEICIPVLERSAGLIWKEGFFVGYSPERINPGDRQHMLTNVVKVVAGDTPETLEIVADLYETIVVPGVHRCSSIKVAEACKVIENTQRDLNIALMNELALIFHKVGIDTQEVLEAAGTKWNFLPFRPGLVGGHCIGVDPYYLTHKAEMMGYHPQVILAGRRINDGMGKYIAEQTIKRMIEEGTNIKGATVCILGITFKENCADIRNSKVIDIINELKTYGVHVCVHDPRADYTEVLQEYKIHLLDWDELPPADAMIAAVAHEEILALATTEIQDKLKHTNSYFIDVKSAFGDHKLDYVWRL
jgi:UDP-N-acetyl-D-galactosamine dehydrogenase